MSWRSVSRLWMVIVSQVFEHALLCQIAFLSEPHLAELALHYNTDLKSEAVMVAKNFIKCKIQAAPQDMLTVYNLLDVDMFPSLKALVQVALTIPVSSCCEQSFSVLQHLHTWLWRTMGIERLHHLAVMSIEKEVLEALNHNTVIDHFTIMKERRYRLK